MLAMGPKAMEGKRVSNALETHGNSLAIDFCELVVAAFTRCHHDDKQAAAVLGMSASNFSKSLRDTNGQHPSNNAVMKKLSNAPQEVIREFAVLLAARVGLSAGIDHAKVQASVEFAEAAMRLLKVSER